MVAVSAKGFDFGRISVEFGTYAVAVILSAILYNGSLLMIKGVSQAVSTE